MSGTGLLLGFSKIENAPLLLFPFSLFSSSKTLSDSVINEFLNSSFSSK